MTNLGSVGKQKLVDDYYPTMHAYLPQPLFLIEKFQETQLG